MRLPKKVRDVVERLGLGFVREPDNTLWTGKALNSAHMELKYYNTSNNVLHELAHFAVAPACYRWQRNFGWSVGPNGPEALENHDAHVNGSVGTTPWRDDEERRAQTLTYLALRALGFRDWESEACLDFLRREQVLLQGGKLAATRPDLVEPGTLRPRFLDGWVPP